ncbi:MAG: MBL fold metallo-hydrolase [Actinobacteria bacterium]|nr:MBL fold metallo-hydrolase [Actinomycetota bacterium]MBU2687138.1 MBL fold metallo-hydrolase [Actinomycetota bacterium]
MGVEYEIIVRGNNLSTRNGSLGLANLTLVFTDHGPTLFDVGHYCNRGALLEGLMRYGLTTHDVKTVFLSHLHFDHCINIDLFRDARVLTGKADWEYVLEPHPDDTFVPWLIREQLRKNELELLEGEGVLAPGVKYMPVPGHTPGCYALVLDCTDGKVVLAGDAIKIYSEVVTKRSSMPFGSEEDASASISNILSLADRIVPGHFPELVRHGDSFVWEDPGELDILIR